MLASFIFAVGCIGCACAPSLLVIKDGLEFAVVDWYHGHQDPVERTRSLSSSPGCCSGIGGIVGASIGGAIALELGWRFVSGFKFQ